MSVRPRRTTDQRLLDILTAIERIQVYTARMSFQEFVADSMLRDSVERNIERISEASRHLPDDLKAAHPQINWRAIANIGNVFRHAYDEIDVRLTWQVVKRELEPLKAAVNEMIARLRAEE